LKIGLLIATLLLAIFVVTISALEEGDEVPGILVIKFEPGIVSFSEGDSIAVIDSSTIKDAEVLDSLIVINADTIEKLFPFFELGDTLVWSRVKGEYVTIPDMSQWYTIYFDTTSLDDAISVIEPLDDVIMVLKDFFAYKSSPPNDSFFVNGVQWHLNNTNNQLYDINASEAWEISHADSIIVGVIDFGFNFPHEDFTGRLIENGSETGGNNPEHGNPVAGIICANINNDITDTVRSVAGVAWGARVKVRIGNARVDTANVRHLAQELAYLAGDLTVDVINCSWHFVYPEWGPDSSGNPMEDALITAYNRGAVVVGGLSNAEENSQMPLYDTLIVAVSSVGYDSVNDELYRPVQSPDTSEFVDIAAPGDSIYTISYYPHRYLYFRGVSAAAPIVAGVVALIKQVDISLSVSEIQEILYESAVWHEDCFGVENDFTRNMYGNGMVDAFRALALANGPPLEPTNLTATGIEDPEDADYIIPRLEWDNSESADVEWNKIESKLYKNRRRWLLTTGAVVSDSTGYTDDIFSVYAPGYPTNYPEGTWARYVVFAEDIMELEGEGDTCYFGDSPIIIDPLITQNTTWNEGYYYITDSMIVNEGVTLTISNDTYVMIDPDVYIDVYGGLVVNGTEGNEVIFYCEDSTETWEGIRQKVDTEKGEITIDYCQIENAEVGLHAIDSLNDDNRISHVTFTDCDWGVYQDSTELDVDSCEFTGGEKGIYVNDVATASDISEYHGNTFDDVDIGIHGDNSVVYIYDCDISNTTDEGIYLDDCDNSLISNVTVDSAGSYGIYIKYSNNVTIDSTESTYNDESGLYFYESGGTVYWSDFTDNLKSGVRCNNSSPTISSCIISDNGTHGLSCTSSAQPSLYQRNTLEDNAGYQFATTYMYFPVTNNGLNNIFCAGNNSILNYTAASKPHFDYPCTNNYWGGPSIDPYKLFYSYNPADTIMYVYYPPAGSQYPRSAQKRTLSTYDDSLSAAFAHESLREWSDASRIFYWIAVNDSSDFNRSTAILHWLHDDNADSSEWAERHGLLEEIEDDLDEDSELFEPIGDATARCLVGARRWSDAISIYTDRMENALDLNDSLIAEIHIGAIYVNWAGALNSPERPGGRRKAAPGNPLEPETSFDPTEWETLEYQLSKTSTVPGSQDWKPVSRAAYEKRVREILAILDKQAHTDEALALLPTKYELSAPYPNPFNPSVVVPFALPENTKLRLVIFDILGREVVELADRNIQAGYHRVVWDGKNSAGIPVASGVYIVRLESDKFTAVKKAVMIK